MVHCWCGCVDALISSRSTGYQSVLKSNDQFGSNMNSKIILVFPDSVVYIYILVHKSGIYTSWYIDFRGGTGQNRTKVTRPQLRLYLACSNPGGTAGLGGNTAAGSVLVHKQKPTNTVKAVVCTSIKRTDSLSRFYTNYIVYCSVTLQHQWAKKYLQWDRHTGKKLNLT